MSQILVDSSMSKPHETNCYKFPNTIRENHLVCSESTKTKNSSDLENNADSRVNSRPKQNFTRAVSNESAIGRNKVPQQINSSNQSISYKGNSIKSTPKSQSDLSTDVSLMKEHSGHSRVSENKFCSGQKIQSTEKVLTTNKNDSNSLSNNEDCVYCGRFSTFNKDKFQPQITAPDCGHKFHANCQKDLCIIVTKMANRQVNGCPYCIISGKIFS